MNFSQLNFGIFALKIYGIIVAFSFVIAAWHYHKSLQKREYSLDFFFHHFWRWLLSGLVIGRVFSLLVDPSIFARNGLFSFFAFWDGEIHFLGTLLGFLILMWRDTRKSGKTFLQWTDVGMKSLFLGLIIVDIGGFLTGAIYGTETSLPWGIQYETFGVDILTSVHPITLYALGIHLCIWWYLNKREEIWKRFVGKTTFFSSFFYFGTDFFLQFFRADETLIFFNFVRIEQFLDVLFLGALWWLMKRHQKKYL
jgi:phosphatidylglycerol:prolipoprotein diacylglycerol transferase